MTADNQTTPPKPSGGASPEGSDKLGKGKDPDWAHGLKRLYDSVVDEPLPDSFQNLLDQLDAKS